MQIRGGCAMAIPTGTRTNIRAAKAIRSFIIFLEKLCLYELFIPLSVT
jgi:hypothetical protein